MAFGTGDEVLTCELMMIFRANVAMIFRANFSVAIYHPTPRRLRSVSGFLIRGNCKCLTENVNSNTIGNRVSLPSLWCLV